LYLFILFPFLPRMLFVTCVCPDYGDRRTTKPMAFSAFRDGDSVRSSATRIAPYPVLVMSVLRVTRMTSSMEVSPLMARFQAS
jgi:hypothetical protein